MVAIAFDTHRAVKALKEAGFKDAQAEAVVATVGAATGESLATRADLQALELQVAGRFESLYKHLRVMAVGIVGGTVALVKLIP